MNTTVTPSGGRWKLIAAVVVLGSVVVVAVLTRARWLPAVQRNFSAVLAKDGHNHDEAHGADHSHGGSSHSHDSSPDHSHGGASSHVHESDQHEGHDDASAIELSAEAWKNVGLRTGRVQPKTFVRTVAVPAIVVERPGRSQVELAAYVTGIVTRVYRMQGEAIQPGQPLFTVRLTHEDLVTAQQTFLQSVQELDILQAEIKRLTSAGEGVIAGRRLLEQKYEQQKTEAAILAGRQGLLLHGLSDEQIDQILKTRTLLQTLTVTAPEFAEGDAARDDSEHLYHVQKINVRRGQHVSAGTTLGVLADHRLLYVEGRAFEEDASRLMQAAREGWTVNVSPVASENGDRESTDMKVLFVADHIDAESRALKFYLVLNNQRTRSEQQGEHKFVAWKYRPGQRMEVHVPTAVPWRNQVVLPVEAVAEEGAEAFVFQQNGDHFDRIAVHVIYRDKDVVVLENDQKLVGTTIAMSGAFQMQLALKNKAGGGVQGHGHVH